MDAIESSLQGIFSVIRETIGNKGYTLYDFKAWLIRYLNIWNDEIKRFPSIKKNSHWDMTVRGVWDDIDAPFGIILFTENHAYICLGYGDYNGLRKYADSGPINTIDNVISDLDKKHVTFSRTLKVNIAELMWWLEASSFSENK